MGRSPSSVNASPPVKPSCRAGTPAARARAITVSATPGSTVLDFGRYSGWSLDQIARKDPDFLEWLARMPIGRPYRSEIEALLSSQPQQRVASRR